MSDCCPLGYLLIESSSSKLLVTRTGFKARTCLISGRIRLFTLELLALEWRKFYTFELEYPWGQLANLDQILCVASLGEGKGCIMFWGRLDKKNWYPWQQKAPIDSQWGKRCLYLFSVSFDPIFFYTRTSSNFGQIGTLTMELAALERLKNFP